METDRIETLDQYAAALAEIDGLGDPEKGTAEYERLDHLVGQVVEYEAVHYPMPAPSTEAMAEYEAERLGHARTRRERFGDPNASPFHTLSAHRKYATGGELEK